MAVDYQAKRWEHMASPWGLRYLKLLIPRKLAFVSCIVPLFLCDVCIADSYMNHFRLPALPRFLQLHQFLGPQYREDLRLVVLIYEKFLAALRDDDFLAGSQSIQSKRDIQPGSVFDDMHNCAIDLQRHLQRIFFESGEDLL